MDFLRLDPESGTPPYEQVRVQVAARVATGTLSPGTRLPTVRSLAADLGLAVNTVARAYRALEADGLVVTEGRRGTFVSFSSASSSVEAEAASTEYAATARRLGLSLPEATRLLERAW